MFIVTDYELTRKDVEMLLVRIEGVAAVEICRLWKESAHQYLRVTWLRRRLLQ